MKIANLKILQTGLLSVLILSPLFFGSAHVWSALSFSLIFFLLVFLHPESLLEIRKLPPLVQVLTAVILIYAVLQAFLFSTIPSVTQIEMLKWLACASGFLLVQYLSSSGSPDVLLKAVVWISLFEACYGLIQTLPGMDAVLWRHQESHAAYASGTFLNRNHLAGLLQMGLGVQAGYLLQSIDQGNKRAGIFYSLLLLFCFSALVKTGSRMGLISFLTAALTFCFLLQKFRPVSAPFRFGLFWIFLAGLGFFFGQKEIGSRFSGSIWEQSWGGRHLVWNDTVSMITHHPWLGTGLGTYEWAFPQYQSSPLLMKWAHAHNDYLELAATLGLPAFILFGFTILVLFFVCLWRTLKQKENFPLAWGILLGLFSFLIHGFTDFNWAMTSNAFWFFLLLSATYRLNTVSKPPAVLRFFSRIGIQAGCLVCVLLAGQKAWAGGEAYIAGRAFIARDFSHAFSSAEKGLKIDSQNLPLQVLLGKSTYELGIQKNDAAQLERAEAVFKGITESFPDWAEGWAYRALALMGSKEISGKTLSRDEWADISIYFDRALEGASSSPWVSYTISTNRLKHKELLGSQEKKQALELLKYCLSLHYPGHTSPYLRPALRFLWQESSSFELLLEVTPQNYESYRVLLGFIEEKKLWKFHADLTKIFNAFKETNRQKNIAKGWRLLSQSKTQAAFEVFQNVYWSIEESLEARVGMLIAGSRNEPPLYSSHEAKQWLAEILEQEEETPPHLGDLEGVVRRIKDSYLQGLWAYRRGDCHAALPILESEAKMLNKTRRWRADCYQRLGEKSKAVALLKSQLLETNPDIRDLLFLKRMDSSFEPAVNAKIQDILNRPPFEIPYPSEGKAASSVWVNLMPGSGKLSLPMRVKAEPSYVRFSLVEGERQLELGRAYIAAPFWTPYTLNFKTSGGGRLLVVEILSEALPEWGLLEITP